MNNILEPALRVKERVEFLTGNIRENIRDNLNERYRDELFLTIKRDPELKKLLQKIKILLQYLTLFGWFFFILAIISIFFYSQKSALILFGLTSIIHIIFAPLALIALNKQNRYILFIFCLANLVWLFSTSFAFVYFLFIVSKEDQTKKAFSREIVVHVGFSFYYPIAFFTTLHCMRLFDRLISKTEPDRTPSNDRFNFYVNN